MRLCKIGMKNIILFLVGGILYYFIEILWRGYSHPSMIIVGGLGFVCVGLINEFLDWKTPLVKQCAYATAIILTIEFVSGFFLNTLLGLAVWDYSDLPFNVCGLICVQYAVLWFFLAAGAIILDDFLRWRLFNEPFEEYLIF